jgi:hypothetical protein
MVTAPKSRTEIHMRGIGIQRFGAVDASLLTTGSSASGTGGLKSAMMLMVGLGVGFSVGIVEGFSVGDSVGFAVVG